jgi:hypothetical protein
MRNIQENFQTVFIINNGDRSVRGKNIVYRQNFHDIHMLTDIDFIFLDFSQNGNLLKIEPLLRKDRPVIFVEGIKPWPVEDYKFLRSCGYVLVEFFKNMHKWIIQS